MPARITKVSHSDVCAFWASPESALFDQNVVAAVNVVQSNNVPNTSISKKRTLEVTAEKLARNNATTEPLTPRLLEMHNAPMS